MGNITHIDCFAGPGGICTGFKAAGIKTVLAIEKVQSCVETYQANHPEVPVIHKDIRKVTEDDIKKHYSGTIDIVTSGMPCETFSTAGSKSRSFYDDRQFLFCEAIRIAKIVNAKLILFENVPGILTKKVESEGNRLIIDEIYDALSRAGYKYYIPTTLNATDFGVPQYRNRFFILATTDSKINLKVPISFHNGKVTVNDALIDLPLVDAIKKIKGKKNKILCNDNEGVYDYIQKDTEYTKLMKNKNFWKLNKSLNKVTYHIQPKHRVNTIKRFKLIKQGEGLKDLFRKFKPEKIKKLKEMKILPKRWYIQRNRRLESNKPSVTVTSHALDELVHPQLNRALTIREVARLQSFPDMYDFQGGPLICPHIYETQDKYEQIGDAVPPLLAYNWAKTIKSILGIK